MKYLHEAIHILLAVAILVAGIMFAIDRELARRESIKNPDGQVTGCIWEINCNHYNKG